MTYRELSKELGIGSSKLMEIENEGLLRGKGTAVLLGNLDDEDVKTIRMCCLFSMLGIPDNEAFSLVRGEIDLRATLKKHVDEILADDSNHTQAAIVMQNLRRECASIQEVDPEFFLQHIKELKHSGGLFYDVNSARLEDNKSSKNRFGIPENRDGETKRNTPRFFGFWSNGDESDTSEDFSRRNENYPEKSSQSGEDGYKNQSPDINPYSGENRPSDINTPSGEKTQTETQTYPGDGYKSEGGTQQSPDASLEKENGGPELYDSTESTSKKSAGYDENWSPYTDRGFGASNMGSGNWHGWSPGYGAYSAQVGARARINNGEKTCPHPFRRFGARILDTTLVTLIGGAVLKLGFRVNITGSLYTMAYIEIIFWLFEMMIEPLLLTSIGTTPGKWIMGITVRDMKTKEKLDIKQAYIRSLKLAWRGFGFMIPIFTIVMRMMSFIRCRYNDTMPWDTGIDVELKDENTYRIVLCILGLIVLNVGDEIVSKQALIPQHRGEITSEQFYENVVEIMKYTGYVGDIPEFELGVKNGYVNSVKLTYTDEQTNVSRYDEMYLGFLAFAGAANDSNGFKLLLTSSLNQMKSYYTSFQDSYCGVNLNNISDSEIKDGYSYSLLLGMLYGNDFSVPAFNQTFTMTK